MKHDGAKKAHFRSRMTLHLIAHPEVSFVSDKDWRDGMSDTVDVEAKSGGGV